MAFALLLLSACGKQPSPMCALEGESSAAGSGVRQSEIAFFVEKHGRPELWAIDSRGDNQRFLADSVDDGARAEWSPDGAHLIFVGWSGDDRELFSVRSDGTNLTRLTYNDGEDSVPVWSPEGERIAFFSLRGDDGGLYLMNSDGSGQRKVGDQVANEFPFGWWADGEHILLQSYRYDERGARFELEVLSSSGSDRLHQTTPRPQVGGLVSFAPEACRIAFVDISLKDDPVGNDVLSYDLWTLDLIQGEARRLTDNAGDVRHVAISPDGLKVAFTLQEENPRGRLESHLYVINSDGSGLLLLKETAHSPSWSADGRIAFVDDSDGWWDIFVTNSDGTGTRRLTDSPEVESNPVWAP